MFERYTDDARRLVVMAQEESRLEQSPHIGTRHFLLALATGFGATSEVLREVGFDPDVARRNPPPPSKGASGHIPFTVRANLGLDQARSLADRLQQDHIDTPHLLHGLLSVPDGGAAVLLATAGVDRAALGARVEDLVRGDTSGHG